VAAPTPYLIELTEGETATYTASLQDENGAPVSSASLSGARLTYYSVHTGAIINGRNNQNILNANNVTISAGGALAWKLQEADVRISDAPIADGAVVSHRAVFVFEWLDSGLVPRQMVREVTVKLSQAKNAPFS